MRAIDKVREDVQKILNSEWIYFASGRVVYETIIERVYPYINVNLLCDLYDDYRGYQDEIIKEYVRMAKEREELLPDVSMEIDENLQDKLL